MNLQQSTSKFLIRITLQIMNFLKTIRLYLKANVLKTTRPNFLKTNFLKTMRPNYLKRNFLTTKFLRTKFLIANCLRHCQILKLLKKLQIHQMIWNPYLKIYHYQKTNQSFPSHRRTAFTSTEELRLPWFKIFNNI